MSDPVFGPFTVQTLVDNAHRLSDKDRAFAASLLDTYYRCRAKGWELKPGSAKWLAIMADRSVNGQKPVAREQIGSFEPIAKMFAAAEQHLKAPAIVIHALGDDNKPTLPIRLKLARSGKEPGSVFVTENGGGFEDRTYFGRISKDGSFTASRSATDDVKRGLRAFASDPVGTAREYGRLTGKCCFCSKPLKDERSTAVGYGAICAGRYDLEWGHEKHEFKAA